LLVFRDLIDALLLAMRVAGRCQGIQEFRGLPACWWTRRLHH
jgi:hypothetical protein